MKTRRVEGTDAVLNKIADRIVERFKPVKIILFGSRAWGGSSLDSDVDLFVIMESEERPAKRAVMVRNACPPKFLPMDVLVRTPEEVRKRLEMRDAFIESIIGYGERESAL
ncbi:MAG: nucleotidyltransferase domain-containing protein [bacterium]